MLININSGFFHNLQKKILANFFRILQLSIRLPFSYDSDLGPFFRILQLCTRLPSYDADLGPFFLGSCGVCHPQIAIFELLLGSIYCVYQDNTKRITIMIHRTVWRGANKVFVINGFTAYWHAACYIWNPSILQKRNTVRMKYEGREYNGNDQNPQFDNVVNMAWIIVLPCQSTAQEN